MTIFTKTKHVSEEAMGLHAMNDLPETRRDLVAEHLSGCSHCRSQFHEVQEFITILRLAAKRTPAVSLSVAVS
ncbi:MAG TPA: zf-HC2 domain-containing protein [Bryobacteraceae bacterium]|nr:zf-HC2 domain-containing protein [Bryobacteraceae bacterium]